MSSNLDPLYQRIQSLFFFLPERDRSYRSRQNSTFFFSFSYSMTVVLKKKINKFIAVNFRQKKSPEKSGLLKLVRF